MSGFNALNIESDDESDIEIDDTKEIQIEEALKLYQIALKYHSEGPDSFAQASEAYQALFDSDIFKYPESQAELQRIELYGAAPEVDGLWDDVVSGSVTAATSLDTGPSTLPQVLHLSHKNFAQFKLDALDAKLDQFNVTLNQVLADALVALDHFVKAIDKDDSDIDLWRRTASVGEILDSKRVARFCLESVLDGDDDGLNGVLSLPGLEEGFAGEQLRDLIAALQDQLSMLQGPLSTTKRKALSKLLKQGLHPYDGMISHQATLRAQDRQKAEAIHPKRAILKTPATWADLGEELLRHLMAAQHGKSVDCVGQAVCFDLSATQSGSMKVHDPSSSPEEQSPPPNLVNNTAFPTSIAEQFPGLDHGVPTVQPQIAFADPSMGPAPDPADEDAEMIDTSVVVLPSRKRSGDTAGLNEGTEESRSKRRTTRGRESNINGEDSRQAIIDANARWEFEQQLNEVQAADDWMFETVGNLFERVGIVGFGACRNVRQDMQLSTTESSTPSHEAEPSISDLRHAKSDLQAFLQKYNNQLANLILHGGENLDISKGSSASSAGSMFASGGTSKSIAKLPTCPDDGLAELLQSVNSGWLLVEDVAWLFIQAMLRPGLSVQGNTYTEFLWPEHLKTMIVRTLVNFDRSIFRLACSELEAQDEAQLSPAILSLAEVIQTIFELHLDIYCLIKQPNSGVDEDTVIEQGDRLQRWSELAREVVQLNATIEGSGRLESTLNLRFLWATTFNIGASSEVSQDHVIECMRDLRSVLVASGQPAIYLQNNAIMPELSTSALDREVSKLTTRDFFLKVTDQDLGDPAAVIENLEPLLESLDPAIALNPLVADDSSESASATLSHVSPELIKFLESSHISIRLLLWQRLRDAYYAIEYTPMVVYCYFRMIRMILGELKRFEVVDAESSERQVTVLKSFRLLLDMVKKLYELITTSENPLECIDESGLRLAVDSFGEILQLIQVFNVTEDVIRVGQAQPPTLANGNTASSFTAVSKLMHEAQVQMWIMLYALFKEAISQNAELFPTPLEDRFDFLRTVHRNLGIRTICGSLNRAFVRLLKEEFLHMSHIDGYDSEQAQTLYDLYGLNCFLNPSYELIEHGCTKDAILDRGSAMQATDLLLAQSSKLAMKDLVKHTLKDTIEKVHGALPKKKPTDAILRNRDVYRTYLRSPLNPLDIYNCLKGEGNHIMATSVAREDAPLVSKGWYFLMGQISLTRFRSQKRTAAVPTEDVDIAIAFFTQDLEFAMEHWETWFRLAQAYDTKIEESVVWSAEKLNTQMPDIILLQRNAIHCYTMATALAQRSADFGFETSAKMTELYTDFATRLYSSSREPFSMQAFALEDIDRFVSNERGVIKEPAFQPLRVYTAWKLASVLFGRALAGKPDNWMLHYMIGKCLWKMHSATESVRRHDIPPPAVRVLESFVRALELLPDKDKKESRDSKREPVLEPHYKLVTIVHKLVLRGSIDLAQAKEALDHTHHARKETFPDNTDGWPAFMVAVLKNLRTADKSNWYHRMIARAAQIVYSMPSAEVAGAGRNWGASGAKNELTQQMFTKTMNLQVWRPESERAGRHFVYTARYTRFFVQILKELGDRASLETLARRVRKRLHDIFEHSLVWQDICNAYLALLRAYAELPEGLETSTFSNIAHEDFLARKPCLEKWMQSQDQGASRALDVLREVQELKKINQSLMKPGAIDDLIGDSYAHLFNTIGKTLWDEERRVQQEQEEEARRQPPPVVSPPRNPMMSLHHLMNIDGASEAPTRPDPAVSTTTPQPTEPAPSRRKTGVGRREIRTCAEAGFQKSTASGGATSGASKTEGPVIRPIQIVIDRQRGLTSAENSAQNSAPGSIHDSADDESELSELEEEGDEAEAEGEGEENDAGSAQRQLIRPMFPGLAVVNMEQTTDADGQQVMRPRPVFPGVDWMIELSKPAQAESADGQQAVRSRPVFPGSDFVNQLIKPDDSEDDEDMEDEQVDEDVRMQEDNEMPDHTAEREG
ncbi:unnamed protein product [Zymoseptoria tritici ST99CH_3D1]|uniref:Histone transcription regulator 3 homolog n=2 Tax=Zymoseptoria tritici TaxID=1047171 RepID=A0A1X7RJ72_ZYMT9|nr:unnamed protein product [Zymoseptoria tritici ST99CH_3D7]SMR45770.1 unnamed protein product [Zymoseptoria tritici ST99CH_1E4]SMR47024.1 unnamed protein product [Zymoseptoria tritici ST99CH_3D1]